MAETSPMCSTMVARLRGTMVMTAVRSMSRSTFPRAKRPKTVWSIFTGRARRAASLTFFTRVSRTPASKITASA